MEGKDDRSKAKRSKMKQYKQRKAQHFAKPTAGHTSSSSQVEAVRGIIDVADSSDEHFNKRGGWMGAAPPTSLQQQRKYSSISLEDDAIMNETENAQMHAGDYDLMAQLPSASAHFKFASEKNWDTPDAEEQLINKTEASEYFTLNLKLLNVGLQTIPFYKRLDYPASLFSREQLAAMEQAAELAEKNYQNVLKEHEKNLRTNSSNNAKRRVGSAMSQNSAKPASSPVQNAPPDELDELLGVTTEEVARITIETGAVSAENVVSTNIDAAATGNDNNAGANKDDIQQWLDNVLEE